MTTQFYAMDDVKQNGMFPITLEEAKKLNGRGYGIFFAVQELHSDVRQIKNLKAIRCIALDIDTEEGGKQEILGQIQKSPLLPSLIVESKNGYHVYWIFKRESWVSADDPEQVAEDYRIFLQERFVPIFKSDERCCDVTRVLRMPHFNHLKNPDSPFLVKPIYESKNLYTLDDIKAAFPIISPHQKPTRYSVTEKYDMKFPADLSVENIKRNVSIMALAERMGLSLKKQGAVYKTRCTLPFHGRGDKNGSLAIYPDSNSFHCFGCGAGGSVIDFYIAYCEEVSVHEAILGLKKMFGGNNVE